MFKNLIPWRKRTDVPVHRDHPPREIARFRDEFDSLLDRFWSATPSLWDDFDPMGNGWGCETEDSDKEIVVRAEAPGFDPDDIEIRMSGDRLVLQAEHREEAKENSGRIRSKFYRSMTLPRGIETEKIQAEYKNGVLEIHLPKGPDAQAKRIPVKAK